MTKRNLLWLAAACALALGGCGDGESQGGGTEAEPVGQELGGSVAPLAVCSDWLEATDAEKLATIEDIRSQVNRQDAGVTSLELSDERALEVFDHGCANPAAIGFRLHIMYARAASFEVLRKVAEGEDPSAP